MSRKAKRKFNLNPPNSTQRDASVNLAQTKSDSNGSQLPAAPESTNPLSREDRESISLKLHTTWEQYIDLIHRFISINTSVIVAVALTVWFLPRLRPGETTLVGKWLLVSGLLLLLASLILEVTIRIWV